MAAILIFFHNLCFNTLEQILKEENSNICASKNKWTTITVMLVIWSKNIERKNSPSWKSTAIFIFFSGLRFNIIKHTSKDANSNFGVNMNEITGFTAILF